MLGRCCLYDTCYLSLPREESGHSHRLDVDPHGSRLVLRYIIAGLLVVGLGESRGVAKNSWLVGLTVIHLQTGRSVQMHPVRPHMLTVHR